MKTAKNEWIFSEIIQTRQTNESCLKNIEISQIQWISPASKSLIWNLSFEISHLKSLIRNLPSQNRFWNHPVQKELKTFG